MSFGLGDKLRLLALAADPAGSEGDTYWSTTLKAVRQHNGTAWQTLGAAGPAGGQNFSTTIGDGVNRVFVVTHSLNTKLVNVAVFQTAAPYSEVTAEVERTDANTVTVRTRATDPAPTALQYTVVVMASGSPTLSSLALDPWHYVGAVGEPAFQNGWTNFDAGTTRRARFRKDPFGNVQIEGVIKSGTSGTTVFTLPAGYRPGSSSGGQESWAVAASLGFAALAIDAGGNVSVSNVGSAAVATYCFLDGAEFDTDTVTNVTGLSVAPTMDPWHVVGAAGEPAFQNSWVNFGGAMRTAAFQKDPFGRVHLRGVVKGGTTGGAGIVFTLPAGYRPTGTVLDSVDANVAFGDISLTSAGAVIVNAGSNIYVSLDGVSFDTESVTSFPVMQLAQPTPARIAWPHAAGWADLSSTFTCGYRKTAEGLVVCEGMASPATAKAVAVDLVIATLPVGYRPNTNVWVLGMASGIAINSYGPYNAAPVNTQGPAGLYVDTSGQVHLYGVGLAAGGWVSLSNIHFFAA